MSGEPNTGVPVGRWSLRTGRGWIDEPGGHDHEVGSGGRLRWRKRCGGAVDQGL